MRRERFAVGASSTASGAAGGVMGAMIAQQLRHDRGLLLPLLAVAVALVTVVYFVSKSRTQYVELDIPLCARHDAEWSEGITLRRNAVVVLLAGGLGAAVGYALDVPFLLGTGLVAFVGSIVLVFAAKLPSRFVQVVALQEGVASLTGVAQQAIDAMTEPSRKKPRRRKKKDAAGEA